MIVVAVILLLAGQLARILRPAFVDFLTRVLALLLSAIAVQLMVDAVRALIGGSIRPISDLSLPMSTQWRTWWAVVLWDRKPEPV